MNWKNEWKSLSVIAIVFIIFYNLPIGQPRFDKAMLEALHLTKWYAQEHVILCLLPAFFIAGAIAVFISSESVMKYLGAKANKILAYGVASISGTILAVCSCTVLPLFAGIYRMGAGLGPASAFLYSGPAINVLAIILTARILGTELGIARAVGAIVFSVIIGLLMHFFFKGDENERISAQPISQSDDNTRPLWQNGLYFLFMVAILVFANWGKPNETNDSVWNVVYAHKWQITSFSALCLGIALILWFSVKWWKIALIGIPPAILSFLFPNQPVFAFASGVIGLSVITGFSKDETSNWFNSTWEYAKQVLPLLFMGVLVAGALLGRPNEDGLIPSEWIATLVGGNSLGANLFASVIGAFMYFATLTEVPILQGLIGNGMGKGPALALLLSGPALSLPNMLVIRSIMGTKKTVAFVSIIIVMSTIAGLIYGAFF